MDANMLEALKALEARASAGPWYVRLLNDDACMTAVAVSTEPADERSDLWSKIWPAEEIVAGCLIQEPAYVLPGDGRWNDNAELIAAMRNALPDLLRLAAKGLAAERAASS